MSRVVVCHVSEAAAAQTADALTKARVATSADVSVGFGRAKELIFTGRFVSAAEALQIGLVDRVVPDDEVYSAAMDMAEQFARGPAYALRAAKEAIDRGLEVDLETGLEIERVQFAALFATQDRTIGMESFIENGPGKANFVGH